MVVHLFGLLPLEGITLFNIWLSLNILPMILFLTAVEPSLNTGRNKYVLWALFTLLFLSGLQINYIAGGWFNALTVYSFVMYIMTAWIGYSNWGHVT